MEAICIGCLPVVAFTVGILYQTTCFAKLDEGQTFVSGTALKLCHHLCKSDSACFRCRGNTKGSVCQTGSHGVPGSRVGRKEEVPQHVNCSSVAAVVNSKGVYCKIWLQLGQTTKPREEGKILLASTPSLNWRLLSLNLKGVKVLKNVSQHVSQITYLSSSKKFFFVDGIFKKLGKLSIDGRLENVIKGKYLSIACSEDKVFAGTHSRKPQILEMSLAFDNITSFKTLEYFPASMVVDMKRSHLIVGFLKTFKISIFSFTGKHVNKFDVFMNTKKIMYIEPYGDKMYYLGYNSPKVFAISLTSGKRKFFKLGEKRVSSLCVYKEKIITLGLDSVLYLQEKNQTFKIKLTKKNTPRTWHCCIFT